MVFAFHGYPLLIHELIYRRFGSARFHVHGYREEGTTATSLDMPVLNGMSRHQLAIAALHRAMRLAAHAGNAIDVFTRKLVAHVAYIRAHEADMPEVMNWRRQGLEGH